MVILLEHSVKTGHWVHSVIMMAKDSHCQPLNHIARSSRVSRPEEQARLCLAVTQELYQLKNCTWDKLWLQDLVVPNPVPCTCMHFTCVCHLINEAKVIGEWKYRKLYLYPCDFCTWGYKQTASVCHWCPVIWRSSSENVFMWPNILRHAPPWDQSLSQRAAHNASPSIECEKDDLC